MTRNFPVLSILISLFSAAFTLFIITGCDDHPSRNEFTKAGNTDSLAFVGRETCKSCHEKQYALFTGSDHDRAMDVADSATVLGDFNDVTFWHLGIESRFYKKNGGYFVYTTGPDGEMEEYKVDYVFGVRPLQQYLVAFPGGRYQCLPLCWDTRLREEGGQRWFHIYGDEKVPPSDFLYWTRILQNWNYMCAECHSTNLKKNFDTATASYHTTWSEIDVSCEACHGPGSAHIKWAEAAAKHPASPEPGDMGLVFRFKDPEAGTWVFGSGNTIAQRTVKRDGRKTLETCARCHARRSTIDEDYTFGHSLLDTHRPSLLVDPLYFPDGQIHDEVYVYASFLQSKMYHKGVICSDCHEPHSLKVYVQGNALCYRCHLPEFYGTKSHHFHKENSSGALCVECHMPERTYMQVDPRRDHSMRNPRPDLSERMGTPNACSGCHNNLSNLSNLSKLSDSYYQWYGKKDRGVHYGETFWKARNNYPDAVPELIRLAKDTSLPAMVRSSSFFYLANYQDPSVFEAVSSGVRDRDPLIRYGAIEGSRNLEEDQKAMIFRILMYDSIRLIRTQAASNIPLSAVQHFNNQEKSYYDQVISEYLETEMINADVPFTWMNLGNYYFDRGNPGEAERAYLRAIAIEPYLPMSFINLADLFRQLNQDEKGEEILKEALEYNPGSADVLHALGLALVRRGKTEEGVHYLKQATEADPENSRYAYVYGVGLYSVGSRQEAISVLEKALSRNPYDRDILFALDSYYKEMGIQRKK
ncbi:MAG: tetratricopeptide repeat protein [Bacteroidales bacterium]|nr:tetratricopeptide repeat protein [Bacteroidales bacterium]